ncbi:replication protein [Paenibacillus amylolyticus]|uniref:replication protein n=1 Tax=Paenibacillus amylolyticus TaxID=1451 RepID=UPI003241D3BB
MASPQVKNGYTILANEILDQISRQRFNGIQRSIIDTVWRYTYGYQRKSHYLATTFIAVAIEADLKGVKVEMQRLIDWKVIHVIKEGHGARPRKIAFNKNYDEWTVGENPPPKIKKVTGGESSTALVESSPPLKGESSPPKKERKKVLKKDIKNNKGAAKEMASKTKLVKSREGKQEYAEEVWLKPEEHTKLLNEFGQEGFTWMIDVLSSYKLSVDKFYASDYAVFKKGGWLRMKYEDHLAKQNKPVFQSKSERTKSVLDEAMAKELNGDGTGRRDITNEVHQLGLPELRS